jgi:catechol 2,3-dioxygenase-like lactoylglutathione lyase family enzyme
LRPQPLIAVRDVESSSRWYQRLLGCKSGHGGNKYERLLADDELVLQLHAWDVAHDPHPFMGSEALKPYGNGVLLWFQIADFDAAVSRARGLGAEILEEPHANPNAGHREVWLRDPDGYVVVLASEPGA